MNKLIILFKNLFNNRYFSKMIMVVLVTRRGQSHIEKIIP